MASRMERYYKRSDKFSGRSSKNADIYKSIQNLDAYSNIEGVATIGTTNEVDITKIKKMLKERENFKNERKYHQAMKDSPIGVERPHENLDDERRNYDIMDIKPDRVKKDKRPKNYDVVDVISKAKEDSGIKPDKSRNLKNMQYEEINNLNLRKEEYKNSEEELKELINTISNNSQLNKVSENSGLLDELTADTMVGNSSSISKIIKKEKGIDETITDDMDKSFFSNSFGFSQKDFADLQGKQKKSHKGLVISIIIITLLLILFLGSMYFIFIK